MKQSSRLVLIPAFMLLVAVLMLVLAVGVGGLSAAACAPPPIGWHRVTTLEDFTWLVPSVVVFFVGEYFALSARRVSVRVLASAEVVIASVAVAFFVLATASSSCGGQYAP